VKVNIKIGAVGIVVFVMAVAGSGQIVKAGSVVVQSISNSHPVLTVGGSAVTVRVTGQNLDLATGAVALLNGTPVKDIVANLGPAGSTAREVTLSANPALTTAVKGYRLRILAGSQAVDVPPDIFVMDVVMSVRAAGLSPIAPPPVAPVGPPNVDMTRIPTMGRTGYGISIWGRDFVPDRFMVMIGSTPLAITYRSTSEIRATLPSQRMTAPLIVSHGTVNSQVQLWASFEVYGMPTITSVVPGTFNRGIWVDLAGWDLDHARPLTSEGAIWIPIEDNPSPPPYQIRMDRFIKAESWSVAPDGRSARFRAADPYDSRITTLTGKLRLKDNGTGIWDVGSPMPVTWNLGVPLVINAVYPEQKWNGRNVDFVLLTQNNNTLIAEGYGIKPETRAKMGSVDLTTRSCSGTRGEFGIPYQATSNRVQFFSGTLAVTFPMLIQVGLWPKWDPGTAAAMGTVMSIILNKEYVLRGWGFKPTIPGLVISLAFHFTPGLPLQLRVLEQTDNLFRFKIVTTGPLPSNYMNYNEFNPNIIKQFFINGQYQGGTVIYMQTQNYQLVAQ
jgi:hypothetical protein